MTYEIQVTKTSHWITTISVEADSLVAAVDQANELAPNMDYDTETDSHYHIDFVNQICPSDITSS